MPLKNPLASPADTSRTTERGVGCVYLRRDDVADGEHPEELQDILAVRSSEDAVLVLDDGDVGLVEACRGRRSAMGVTADPHVAGPAGRMLAGSVLPG